MVLRWRRRLPACLPTYDAVRRDNRRVTEKKTRVGPAPKLDDGTQLKRVRRVCASIPGTVEKLSHGEPTFFTPKRVFAMFDDNHHGDGHVAVWAPAGPGVQEALIEEAPGTYFRPPYVGAAGWVGVELARVDDEQLGALIRGAFRLVELKGRTGGKTGGSSAKRRIGGLDSSPAGWPSAKDRRAR